MTTATSVVAKYDLCPYVCQGDNPQIECIIECKSRQISLAAATAYEINESLKTSFDELAKGVVQIARFRELSLAKKFDLTIITENCLFVILTLHDWVFTGAWIRHHIYSRAIALAKSEGLSTDWIERRQIAFITTSEIEDIIVSYKKSSVLSIIRKCTVIKYLNWSARSVARQVGKKLKGRREFPLTEDFKRLSLEP